MNITAEVIDGSKAVERVRAITPNVRTALEVKVSALAVRLQRKIRADKLYGQVLKYRSGNLNTHIEQAVQSSNGSVVGIVSTAVKYAAVHEYGFHGTVNVREHLRTIKEAFGKSLREPVTYTVSAHSRMMNMPERSFMRSALADMRDEITEGIRDAVAEGASK
jgi:phage gpG-like protein